MIRAEKTTRNADDFRTLMFGVVAALAILLGLDPALRMYEQYGSSRPWVVPTIHVVPTENGRPDFLYKANVRFPVSGTWTAFLQYENGRRYCTERGEGNYKPNLDAPRLWEWTDWLGRDCLEPVKPYRACVFYVVRSVRNVFDTTDPVCSPLYDPKLKTEIAP